MTYTGRDFERATTTRPLGQNGLPYMRRFLWECFGFSLPAAPPPVFAALALTPRR